MAENLVSSLQLIKVNSERTNLDMTNPSPSREPNTIRQEYVLSNGVERSSPLLEVGDELFLNGVNVNTNAHALAQVVEMLNIDGIRLKKHEEPSKDGFSEFSAFTSGDALRRPPWLSSRSLFFGKRDSGVSKKAHGRSFYDYDTASARTASTATSFVLSTPPRSVWFGWLGFLRRCVPLRVSTRLCHCVDWTRKSCSSAVASANRLVGTPFRVYGAAKTIFVKYLSARISDAMKRNNTEHNIGCTKEGEQEEESSFSDDDVPSRNDDDDDSDTFAGSDAVSRAGEGEDKENNVDGDQNDSIESNSENVNTICSRERTRDGCHRHPTQEKKHTKKRSITSSCASDASDASDAVDTVEAAETAAAACDAPAASSRETGGKRFLEHGSTVFKEQCAAAVEAAAIEALEIADVADRVAHDTASADPASNTAAAAFLADDPCDAVRHGEQHHGNVGIADGTATRRMLTPAPLPKRRWSAFAFSQPMSSVGDLSVCPCKSDSSVHVRRGRGLAGASLLGCATDDAEESGDVGVPSCSSRGHFQDAGRCYHEEDAVRLSKPAVEAALASAGKTRVATTTKLTEPVWVLVIRPSPERAAERKVIRVRGVAQLHALTRVCLASDAGAFANFSNVGPLVVDFASEYEGPSLSSTLPENGDDVWNNVRLLDDLVEFALLRRDSAKLRKRSSCDPDVVSDVLNALRIATSTTGGGVAFSSSIHARSLADPNGIQTMIDAAIEGFLRYATAFTCEPVPFDTLYRRFINDVNPGNALLLVYADLPRFVAGLAKAGAPLARKTRRPDDYVEEVVGAHVAFKAPSMEAFREINVGHAYRVAMPSGPVAMKKTQDLRPHPLATPAPGLSVMNSVSPWSNPDDMDVNAVPGDRRTPMVLRC